LHIEVKLMYRYAKASRFVDAGQVQECKVFKNNEQGSYGDLVNASLLDTCGLDTAVHVDRTDFGLRVPNRRSSPERSLEKSVTSVP